MAQADLSLPEFGADHPRRDLKSIHLTPGQSHIYIVDTWPGVIRIMKIEFLKWGTA